MAKYTIRLDEICKYLYDNNDTALKDYEFANEWGIPFELNTDNPFVESATQDEIISTARSKIFDFDYTLYDDTHKSELETKIIKHYYMQEIGFETYGRWKFALEERLKLILPFYNEMYKSVELQGDNPLINNDYYETRNIQGTGTNSTTVNSTDNSTNRQILQNTPTSKIGNTDYASQIVDNTNETTSNNVANGNNNNTEDMERHIQGLTAYSKQDMIERYRQNIINVDEAIVNELFDLFMLIY